MKVVCPNCNFEHNVRTRGKVSGGWNYHQVQADLSLLVGNQIVSMTSPGKECFNGQEYVISPIPKYFIGDAQKVQLIRIKNRGWRLE